MKRKGKENKTVKSKTKNNNYHKLMFYLDISVISE